MLGFDLSSFDGQPQSDAAHLQLMRSFGKSEPAFGFATVVAIGGYAVMTAQRRHPVWSRNSSNTVPARWNKGCTPESHYPPRVRRLTGSTILDQNRSCIITLSMPNTMIVSHRPELTHKNMVSCCPSMRLSALSANTTKHISAATW